jgi:polyisoprenoid-binding protein YceI
MPKLAKIGIPIVLAVVLVGGAVWYFTMRDTSAPTATLDAIGANASGPTSLAAAPGAGAGADGSWVVQPGSGVFIGYRINEKVLPAGTVKTVNGRTPVVDGTLTVAGDTVTAVTIKADVTKLDSGEPLREQILTNVGLETGKFPTATFALREPLKLPAAPTSGSEVAVVAKGNLTAHGVTHPIDVPLKARWEGDRIKLATADAGAAFKMADWGIDLPKVPITEVDDHGTLELQLLLARA